MAHPLMPGVPAAGHVRNGFWHPGRVDGCAKCPDTGTCDYPNCHQPQVEMIGRFRVCRQHRAEYREFVRSQPGGGRR